MYCSSSFENGAPITPNYPLQRIPKHGWAFIISRLRKSARVGDFKLRCN